MGFQLLIDLLKSLLGSHGVTNLPPCERGAGTVPQTSIPERPRTRPGASNPGHARWRELGFVTVRSKGANGRTFCTDTLQSGAAMGGRNQVCRTLQNTFPAAPRSVPDLSSRCARPSGIGSVNVPAMIGNRNKSFLSKFPSRNHIEKGLSETKAPFSLPPRIRKRVATTRSAHPKEKPSREGFVIGAVGAFLSPAPPP